MNLSIHSLGRDRRLIGLRWYLIPVGLNALIQSVPTLDSGARDAGVAFVSLPYWTMVVVIGLRRARQITLCDFIFLLAARGAIVAVLWHVHPQTRTLPLF